MAKVSRPAGFDCLPIEVQRRILCEYFTAQEVSNLYLVNKNFCSLLSTPSPVWTDVQVFLPARLSKLHVWFAKRAAAVEKATIYVDYWEGLVEDHKKFSDEHNAAIQFQPEDDQLKEFVHGSLTAATQLRKLSIKIEGLYKYEFDIAGLASAFPSLSGLQSLALSEGFALTNNMTWYSYLSHLTGLTELEYERSDEAELGELEELPEAASMRLFQALSMMHKLERLRLSCMVCWLGESQAMPLTIGELPDLRHLSLEYCCFDALPATAQWVRLESLQLSDPVHDLRSLSGLQQLTSLKCKLYDGSIASLQMICPSNLRHLKVSHHTYPADESLPRHAMDQIFEDMFSQQPPLEKISFVKLDLKWVPPALACLAHLKHLDMCFNKMTGPLPEGPWLDNLEHLDLSYNRFEVIDPKLLRCVGRMKMIIMRGCEELLLDSRLYRMHELLTEAGIDVSLDKQTLDQLLPLGLETSQEA